VRALRRVSDPPTFPNRRGVRLCAEIRAGELLAEMSKAKPCGSNQHEEGSRGATDPPTLAEVGVTKSQSSRWQQKAALPPGVTNSSAPICGPRYLARHGMAWPGGADVRISDILPVLTGIAVGVALNWDHSLGDRIVGGLLGAPITFVVWRWLHR
jgi:hypothetical protein